MVVYVPDELGLPDVLGFMCVQMMLDVVSGCYVGGECS